MNTKSNLRFLNQEEPEDGIQELLNFITRCKKDGMTKTEMKKWFSDEVDFVWRWEMFNE